jgi:hypothetical protein
MTTTNGWPGEHGVPLNPEKDGWHWMKTPDNEVMPFEWRVEGECERGRWPSYWVRQDEDCWTAEECEYIGPCLTPDEVQNLRDDLASAERERAHQHGRADRNAAEYAREQGKREALQKRVAKLETSLQFIKDAPDEERKPNFDNMGSYEAGLRYCAAFASAALGETQ